MIGPSPIFQQITCVAGQTCDFQILGMGIAHELRVGRRETDDRNVMILDTCGINSVIEGLPYNWATEVVTASGGTYQLCWCGSSHFSCVVAAEFLLPFGQIHILGPVLQQDRTCVAGQTCRLDGLMAFGLDGEAGELLVLETCGVKSFSPGFPSFGLGQMSSLGTSVDANLSATWSLSSLSWQTTVVTAAAGDYRLCWCHRCDAQNVSLRLAGNGGNATAWERLAPESFGVDVGRLRIQGLQKFQDRTCISGQSCSIDSILGVDHEEKTLAMALETCGVAQTIPGWAWSGSAISTENGTEFSWGTEPVTASGGQYRLCWCAGACHTAEDFLIDFGSMLLLGHKERVSRTCVSGQRCSIRMESEGTELVILDTCGVASQLLHFPAISVLANESYVSFGWVTASAGQFRICWCASDMSCDNAEQFRSDAGSLILLGPTPLEQDRTCVAGQSCRIEGLTGIGLDTTFGTFTLLDTCGTSQLDSWASPLPQPLPQVASGGSVKF